MSSIPQKPKRKRLKRELPPLAVCAADLANLRSSGLTDGTIRQNGLRTEKGSLVFPYRDLDGNVNCFARFRPHKPRVVEGKPVKYLQPKGSPLRAYYPAASLSKLTGSAPIYITEGEKKALRLSQEGHAAIGLGGIYGWKKKGADELIDDLLNIPWEGRDVYIVFDYDAKPDTRLQADNAKRRLAKLLRAAGAKVYSIDLPPGPNGSKQGIDDFLVARGPDAFHELVDRQTKPCRKSSSPSTGLAQRMSELREQKSGQRKHDTADDRHTIYSASELMAMELPEPVCVVAKLITEGLNILVSRPKLGKSWLALTLSIAVALGLFALGALPVLQGDVLYLALEDNKRRLKNRLGKLLGGRKAPERLDIATDWLRMDKGGMENLRRWVEEAENPTLIVIDTLAKVRSLSAKQADRYSDDYHDVGELQKLAEELGVAILILHHDRKAQADDGMDDVSGSIGITAAADTILLMRRERGQHDACIYVHGRDIDEQEIALEWNPDTCHWSMMDESAKDARMSKERKQVLDCIREHGPITPKEIADLLKKNPGAIRRLCRKLENDGDVKSKDGNYTHTPPVTPVTR